MPPLRLLPDLSADGPTQMAADEALLAAAEGPTLRLYRWQPATVSLGYFQDHGAIAARLAQDGLTPPLVRRITGGGAIWHQHEVTYALVGTLGAGGLPVRTADCYRLIHGSVAAALGRRGASLGLQTRSVGDRRYAEEPRCFASPAMDDLVAATGGKALGSAARTRGGRVLIHGSLKLASNPWDGEAVAGCGLDWDSAAAALREGLAQALGAALEPGAWSAAELAERRRIAAERYGDDGWVVRRSGPRP
jgi:lipoate-protein ligase A